MRPICEATGIKRIAVLYFRVDNLFGAHWKLNNFFKLTGRKHEHDQICK